MKNVRGFTLLELLIVVVILAAIAAAAVSVVEQGDDQSRVDITKSRSQQIRDAIVGRTAVINGSPLIEGFVADLGRVPATIAELASPSIVLGNVYRLAHYQSTLPLTKADGSNLTYDSSGTQVPFTSVVGGGWRGPYLLQESDPQYVQYSASFRDGWGNGAPDDLLSGWRFRFPGNAGAPLLAPFTTDAFVDAELNKLQIKSLGSDGIEDVVVPSNWAAADQIMAIGPDDYLVSVKSWHVDLQFDAPSLVNQSVYLRLYYPRTPVPVAGSAWDVSTSLTYVQSGPTTIVDGTTSAQNVDRVTHFTSGFSFPAASFAGAAAYGGDVKIPAGVRVLCVFKDDGSGGDTILTNGTGSAVQIPLVLTPRSTPPISTFFVKCTGTSP